MGYKITSDMRDKILFDVAVLGASNRETAEKFGCTSQTVSQQTLVFNKIKARDWEGVKDMMRSGNVGINLVEWAIDRTKAEPPKGFIDELVKIRVGRVAPATQKNRGACQRAAETRKPRHGGKDSHTRAVCGNGMADANRSQTRSLVHESLLQRRSAGRRVLQNQRDQGTRTYASDKLRGAYVL